MRTDKELLELSLKYINIYFKTGLCNYFHKLWTCNYISSSEYNRLRELISYIKPRKRYQIWRNNSIPKTHSDYWWPDGKITPRIKYLKYLLKHINKLH